MSLEAPQRSHDLGEVFNALRYLVRSGAPYVQSNPPAAKRLATVAHCLSTNPALAPGGLL